MIYGFRIVATLIRIMQTLIKSICNSHNARATHDLLFHLCTCNYFFIHQVALVMRRRRDLSVFESVLVAHFLNGAEKTAFLSRALHSSWVLGVVFPLYHALSTGKTR